MKLKPAFSWPGGKSWALKHILTRIPEHTCYCEVFAGGLAVLMAKEPSALEVINDINSELINFYRCARFHRDELIRQLQWTPNSREEFDSFRKHPGLTDIQRAAAWFYVQTLSFGADGHSYAVTRKSGGGANKSRHGLLQKIDALGERLDRANIENLDWRRCLALYDGDETFFFLDPPYTGCKIGNYPAWSADELQALRDILDALKGKWLLTINDSPESREIFAGLRTQKLTRKRGIANKDGQATDYHELLISPT